MELKKFKERNNKQKSIMIFTIACILLITSVFLYKSFAIYKTNTNQDMINGEIQDIGDLEFAFYVDDKLVKDINEIPKQDSEYSLDTSSSYCKDMSTGKQTGSINWNQERWSAEVKDITTTKTKCYLYFKKIYKEDILNGAIPDLMNGRLVPIIISDTEKPTDVTYEGAQAGKVTKANITDTSNPWYKYLEKKWANAVILRDGKEDTYKAGEEIPESEIESYFVWIPRYQYKLKADVGILDGYKTVTLVGNVDSVSDFYSRYPNQATDNGFEITFVSKEKQNTIPQGTIIHPAFEAFDSNGFWVGKFETGYNQNSTNNNVTPNDSWSMVGTQKNEDKGEKVIIKPNVYSWRGIQVANAFYTSYNYRRELESHMMKNTEWGAVAYLTQSKYGRCDINNKNCTEMNRNNSEYYITGMSTTKAPTCGFTGANEACNYYGGPSTLSELSKDDIKSYYLTDSQGGSTTENYSGIYDMSGGAWEYVMGVMQENATDANPASGKSNTYNSDFKGVYTCPKCDNTNETILSNTTGKDWPSSKYYDLYDYKTTNDGYQRGCLGDGTKEFGPFYSVSYISKGVTKPVGSYNADIAYFLSSSGPWFIRGGSRRDGTDTGVSAFVNDAGHASSNSSFRIVLTP